MRGETLAFLCILPIDFWRAAHVPRQREFPLYHSPANLSIGKMNKIIAQENPVFVQHYLLTLCAVCGILSLSRGKGNPLDNKINRH